MSTPADELFVRALVELVDGGEGAGAARRRERVFRLAYAVLGGAHVASPRTHGRAAIEDATQNAMREFLERLRGHGAAIEPSRAPGLLRVMLWRRLKDEHRRSARYRFGDLDLDLVASMR